ncbi:hypothetical protein GPECTOR_3g456 [Gonium pectorale]|uniref:Uncharacterized protein n=1 Tax=Gonium pectorale TaxID=33097 RepID=A0A150GZZ3_GONPE|nr:hypothetical protein GPECTOR_3g456 [Gonium pectorale]|eukprot:KXZ55323.1 hypothetical protein GPECTOR_3g456 [Gonium pectorale]
MHAGPAGVGVPLAAMLSRLGDYYPAVYGELHRALCSGVPPADEWPAREADAKFQVVFARQRIQASGVPNTRGGMGSVTAATGSTLRRCARREDGPGAGGPEPGVGCWGPAPSLAPAPLAPPAAAPSSGPPLPPPSTRMLLEAKGKLHGNWQWPDGTPVSRYYWAAPGGLTEQQALDLLGSPADARLSRARPKGSSEEVWYHNDAVLIIAPSPGGSTRDRKPAGGGAGGGGPASAAATATAAAAAAAAAGKRREAEPEADGAADGGPAYASSGDFPSESPRPAPPSPLERRGRQWRLAVASNCVYLFMEAALEALLPMLPQREGGGGGGVDWERVHAGGERRSPLHTAVELHRVWPPLSGPRYPTGYYTVPDMPVPVRLRLVRWLLRVSTPVPPHAPLSPQQRRRRTAAAGADAATAGGSAVAADGGGGGRQQGGGRRGAPAGGSGQQPCSRSPATCAPPPPPPTAARSELLMARNTNRSVPLLTLMRHADSDGRDWSPLVVELCAHMAFQDYAAADSKKGWYPHHMASSPGSRPWATKPPEPEPAAPTDPTVASASASTSRRFAAHGSPSERGEAEPAIPLPGSRGCLRELLRQLLRMAAEELQARAAAEAGGGAGSSRGGGGTGTGADPKRRRKSLTVEDDPLAAPNQHGPAPQAAATATAAAAGLVSDLLFHLRSSHYDGRLLDELAAEQGIHVQAAEPTVPSGAFAMCKLFEALEEMSAREAVGAAMETDVGAANEAGAEGGSPVPLAGPCAAGAASGWAEPGGRGRASRKGRAGGLRGGGAGVRVAGGGGTRRRRGRGRGRQPSPEPDGSSSSADP